MYVRKIRSLLILFVVLSFFVVASPAMAATFGDMFTALGTSFTAFKAFMLIAVPIIGLCLVAFGVMKFIQNNPQDSMFDKGIWIIAGGILLAISGFAAVTSSSVGL